MPGKVRKRNPAGDLDLQLDLSADDLALLSAVIIVVGDVLGLLSVLKARLESSEEEKEGKR
ncbi:hypothetical protein ACFO9Q_20605 [Paenibacillus sp. GCM10023252]|uniref:hypothetical protein n=1 Tax=Paenibacillus sp. GCM10023252 TaxID=3252649 RepID=UPI003610E6A9